MARLSNFSWHVLDGVFGAFALSFVAAETILPGMLAQLGAPNWMISLAPAVYLIGSGIPGLLISDFTERYARKRDFIIPVCMPVQKGPYFLMPLLLLLISNDQLLAWLIFLGTLIIGLGIGIAVPPWNRMVAKTVAKPLIPRLMAMRLGIGAVLGVLGGYVVKMVLSRWPDRYGYALLFTFCSLAMTASMLSFARIREPKEKLSPTVHRDRVRGGDLLRNRAIRNFLLVRTFYCSTFLALGFMPMQFCRDLRLNEGYLGIFAALVVVGAVGGNVFTAVWTKFHSERSAMLIGLWGYFGLFLLSLYRGSLWSAAAVFLLLGFSRDIWNATGWSMMMTLPEKRQIAKAGALLMLVMVPPMLVMGIIGGKLLEWSGSYNLVATAAALLLLPAILFASRLPGKSGKKA